MMLNALHFLLFVLYFTNIKKDPPIKTFKRALRFINYFGAYMEKKDDDVISIDFSKITGFFKKEKSQTEAKPATETSTKTQEASTKEKDEASAQQPKETSANSQSTESQKSDPLKKEMKEEKKSESREPAKKDEGKDDEIAIDFSKMKGWFKSGPKEASKKNEAKSSKSDDEITIDFSKVKNMFGKKDSTKDDDSDIDLDLAKFRGFFSKYGMFFILLIPIFLAIFLRVQPAYLPITDEWAQNAVSNGIRNQISAQINQQYPNLPQENKDVLIENEFQRLLGEQRGPFDEQVKATSAAFKERLQDDSGQSYLIGIDPEYWLQHARNIVKNGHPGDELRNGVPYDTHMFAPVGRIVPQDML
ncbi:MAG: hypothetical protein AABZ60_22770, partial [Planctomycetota bacterium]